MTNATARTAERVALVRGLRALCGLCGCFLAGAVAVAQQPPPKPSSPIIVKVITPPHDPTGISDVIIGAIGLTGAIVVLAVVLGLVMAGLLFWFRHRNPLSH